MARGSVLGGVILLAFLMACKSAPTAADSLDAPSGTQWEPDRIRQQVIASNPALIAPPPNDKLVRFATPIAVNVAGIARAEEALQRFERLTRGVISFVRVAGTPERGIVFVDGGALNGDGAPGCGNVSGHAPGRVARDLTYDASGALSGVYYIHLGSAACNDARTGYYSSAIAEHELSHALALTVHFDGFAGNEGLRTHNHLNVIYNTYRNPIGTPVSGLTIEIIPLID